MLEAFSTDGHIELSLYTSELDNISNDAKEKIIQYGKCIACKEPPSQLFTLCRCGFRHEDPFFQYIHERKHGKTNDFIGIYVVAPEQWQEIRYLIKKYQRSRKENVRKKTVKYDTSRIDGNIEAVHSWLHEAYPDFSVDVKEIFIHGVPPPQKKFRKLYEVYKAAFHKNGEETLHHSYLKWFAWNWLAKGEASLYHHGLIFYERAVYIPHITEKCGLSKGHVLFKNQQTYVTGNDKIQRVDVADIDTIVECGETSANCLILPLMVNAVKKTAWLPFPYKDTKSEWPNYNESYKAFVISKSRVKRKKA